MRRFAVYVVPQGTTPLARAANAWLGYDPGTGRALEQPRIEGLAAERLRAITAAPRRYGFHATMKAPFALDAQRSEAELVTGFVRFCAAQRPLDLELRLDSIGGFLALVPAGPALALEALAAACVRDLDPFRAPLTQEDRARRRPERLAARELEHLERWGYPHVMELFHYHMTLTDRLAEAEHDGVQRILARHLTPLLDRPCRIDDLVLLQEPDPGSAFRVVIRAPLKA